MGDGVSSCSGWQTGSRFNVVLGSIFELYAFKLSGAFRNQALYSMSDLSGLSKGDAKPRSISSGIQF